jgi:hypothetical protein
MRQIPLHCVVIALGESNSRQSVLDTFPSHEFLRDTEIRLELIGEYPRYGVNEIIALEIQRRMTVKLKLGERVIVDKVELNKIERIALANAASRCGVPVFYLIFGEVERDAQCGDGLAEVIDIRNVEINSLHPLLGRDLFTELSDKWNGVTVLGDIHGMYQSARAAMDWARQRNHFLVFSGDIVDYGPGTLEVADEVYNLVTRGQGILVLGNHERKIMRWIDGMRARLSDGNRVTTSALQALSDTARQKWIGRFRGLYQNSALYHTIGNVRFVHAALHPAYWSGKSDRELENHAFFGEIDQAKSRQDHPVRSYRWVENIPADHMVIVGHDIRSIELPVVQTNRQGGQAIFMDTGSGKGGHLTSADLSFTKSELKLSHFNIF